MFKRLQMWRSLNKSCKMCESGFYVHDLEQDNNNGMGYTTGPSKDGKEPDDTSDSGLVDIKEGSHVTS